MARKPKSEHVITGLSTQQLQSELRTRMRKVHQMMKRRDRLVEQLKTLDAAIRAAGGSGGVSASALRKRPKNDSNLAAALAETLKGKTMSVTEAAEAVQRAGYVTTAANFRTIVNQTLIKHRNLFKKVSRGQYTVA